jgi:hypothetical protein
MSRFVCAMCVPPVRPLWGMGRRHPTSHALVVVLTCAVLGKPALSFQLPGPLVLYLPYCTSVRHSPSPSLSLSHTHTHTHTHSHTHAHPHMHFIFLSFPPYPLLAHSLCLSLSLSLSLSITPPLFGNSGGEVAKGYLGENRPEPPPCYRLLQGRSPPYFVSHTCM